MPRSALAAANHSSLAHKSPTKPTARPGGDHAIYPDPRHYAVDGNQQRAR